MSKLRVNHIRLCLNAFTATKIVSGTVQFSETLQPECKLYAGRDKHKTQVALIAKFIAFRKKITIKLISPRSSLFQGSPTAN